jgi:hypothetical protein
VPGCIGIVDAQRVALQGRRWDDDHASAAASFLHGGFHVGVWAVTDERKRITLSHAGRSVDGVMMRVTPRSHANVSACRRGALSRAAAAASITNKQDGFDEC